MYCYFAMFLMGWIVVAILIYRLPRALETLRALEEADLLPDGDCFRKQDEGSIPKDWRLEDGPHLFITEDDQMLCKPADGRWLLVDIEKVRRRMKISQEKGNEDAPTTPHA